MVDECSDWKRKVIALFDQVFPEYASLFSDTFGVSRKEVLLAYPTPEDMFAVSSERFEKLLQKSSHGRFSHDKAVQLQNTAKTSFRIKFAKDAFSFQIRQMIGHIKFIEDQLSEHEREISSLLSEINQVITTIIGIGDVLGAIIVSEIGDISHFDSAPKLVAFAGLDVSVK